MTKWEYKVVHLEQETDYGPVERMLEQRQEMIDWLNSFGAEGWEMIKFNGSQVGSKSYAFAVFKRPVV